MDPFTCRQSRCNLLHSHPDIMQGTGATAPRRTELSSAISWKPGKSILLNVELVEVA